MRSYGKLPDDEGELWGVMVSYLMMRENYGELW
jgi:hypothetical protein